MGATGRKSKAVIRLCGVKTYIRVRVHSDQLYTPDIASAWIEMAHADEIPDREAHGCRHVSRDCRYSRNRGDVYLADHFAIAFGRHYDNKSQRLVPLYAERTASASYTAARAAECAGEQGAFWPFHRRLFSSLGWQVGDTKEALKQLAVEVGIADQVGFEACVESETPVPAITADLNAAADLSVSGTPAVLVNGRLSMGVLDSLSFADIYERVRP